MFNLKHACQKERENRVPTGSAPDLHRSDTVSALAKVEVFSAMHRSAGL